ncbi:MAG: MFS transporter, partial [Deltaproteobacteria bacterium]|nr:MFS transporter [Deltaproteobacteria bacterium]
VVTVFFFFYSSDVFLILRAQQVGIATVTIPVVYLLFNFVYSVSSIFAGMAADRFGRKRIILCGFVLFAVVYYGFATVADVKVVWVLFALYGIYMGLTEGVQKAFLTTIIPSDFKAMAFGVYNTAIGLAMFPASFIGGWLWDHISPAATFYFGAVTAISAAVALVAFIVFGKKGVST